MSYNNPEPSNLPNSNDARPFPKFGSFQTMAAPSHSTYHALQAKVQRRFSRGFTLLSSFAYGKSIDNGSGIGDGGDHVVQLEIHLRHRLLHVLHRGGGALNQHLPMPHQAAQNPNVADGPD